MLYVFIFKFFKLILTKLKYYSLELNLKFARDKPVNNQKYYKGKHQHCKQGIYSLPRIANADILKIAVKAKYNCHCIGYRDNAKPRGQYLKKP